jgi:hypothetical protein
VVGALQLLGEALRVTGWNEHPVDPVGDDVAVPAMAEAIAGVPAAKASVRTMPKLSPLSEGAQSRSAPCSAVHSSSPETRPRTSIQRSVSGSAR